MDTQTAYDVLSQAEAFYGSAIGILGEIPKTVVALLSLLDTPQACETFKRLLKEATLVGQLYALCGLYYVDHEAFLEAVEPYRNRDDSVIT